MLTRNARHPGPQPGSWTPKPRPEPKPYVHVVSTTVVRTATPEGIDLERQMKTFIKRKGWTRSRFADAVGQSSGERVGVFVKAREGRLKPATIAKIRRFMVENA